MPGTSSTHVAGPCGSGSGGVGSGLGREGLPLLLGLDEPRTQEEIVGGRVIPVVGIDRRKNVLLHDRDQGGDGLAVHGIRLEQVLDDFERPQGDALQPLPGATLPFDQAFDAGLGFGETLEPTARVTPFFAEISLEVADVEGHRADDLPEGGSGTEFNSNLV